MEIQVSQLIFQIINFSVVMGALTFLAYKPILKTLRQRSQKIEESQKAADALIDQKEKLEITNQKTLNQAKKEAADILAKAKKQALEKKAEMLAEAKSEAQALIEKDQQKWKTEKAKLAKEMESQMNEAVFTVTQKVVGELVTKKEHTKLIDQSIKEVLNTI